MTGNGKSYTLSKVFLCISVCRDVPVWVCRNANYTIGSTVNIYIDRCKYMCVNIYMYTHISHICTSIHPYIHTSIHPSIHPSMHACMQTDRQTDRQTYIHTYIPTDVQTYRRTDVQTDIHTDRHAYIHIYIYTYGI